MAQAGIGTAPAQGRQAGLSMAERKDTIEALRSRGYSDTEIANAFNLEQNTPAPEEDPGYTFGDKAEWAARQAVGMPLEGIGKRLGLDWLTDVGEAISPGEEMQQERAEARQARADAVEDGDMTKAGEMARNVGDSVVESSGSLAGAIGTGAAGGALVGSVAGPMGAAVGAALGAAAYGVASMYGEAYQQAEDNGLDTSDPNVKAHIDAAALAGGALDAIPSFRILRKFAPDAAQDLIVEAGMKGIAKKAGKEGAKEFGTEGVTEVSQEALQAVLLDPDVVAAMSTQEKMELAPEILQQHGPQFLEAFLAGGILGGAAGGVGGAKQASRAQKLAAQKELVEKEQGKLDMEAGGRIAEDQFIPAEALDPGEDAEAAEALKADLRSIRQAEAKASMAASIYEEARKKELPEADLKPLEEDAVKKINNVQKMKDDFATKRGGMTKAAAEAARKQEAETRAQTARNALRKSGISVTAKDATPELIEEHAGKVADARSKTSQARQNYKSSPESAKPRRRKQLEKAITKEAEALEAADVALGEREPRARYNEHIAQMGDLIRAADREGAKEIFLARDWADIDTLTPEQKLERANEIIGKSKTAKGPKAEEAKAKIKKLRARQENVQSPEEYYNLQEQIDAAQASLNVDTPKVQAAREVASAAQAEIRQALEAQADTEQPLTADGAEQGEEAGSAGQQTEPESTVEGADANQGETPSTAAPQQVNPRNVTPETRKALGDARKAFRKNPTDKQALSALEAAGKTALAEAGIPTPSPEQLNEAIKGGGSVAERIVRASRMAVTETPEPSTPTAAAEEAPAASDDTVSSPVEDLAAGISTPADTAAKIAASQRLAKMDEGQDINRNYKWRSLREQTDIGLPLEEQEQFMREQTAADPQKAEIAAVFLPDGTLAGIGTNGDHNGVTAPKNGWRAGGTYTHSHPFETPMSPADVGMMKAGAFSVLRAVLPSQTVEIRPGPNLQNNFDPATYYYHVDRAMRQVLEDAGKTGINEIAYARITQEASLQAMHVDGIVDYTVPMEGFTDEERGYIDAARTAVLGNPRRPGAPSNDGLRTAEAGAGGRPNGIDGPQLAAGTAESAPEIDIAAFRKKLEREWKDAGGAKFVTFDDLMEVAPANQKLLTQVAYRIAADLGVTFKDGGVKGRVRAEEKMAERGVNAGELTDVVRGGFMAETSMEAGQIANALMVEFGVHDVEVMDEGMNVTDAGYFDQKLMVRFPNGQVGEIQIWQPHLFLAKEGRNPVTMDRVEGFTPGHRLYVESRSLPRVGERTPEQQARHEELNRQMQELYASAVSLAHPSFQAMVFGKDPSLAAASGNRLRQALSDIIPADPASNMLREQGLQSPLTNTNVPPGTSTTGSVSANPNSMGSSVGDGDTVPTAEGLAKPEDVKPRKKTASADPEKVGELGTAAHQRILEAARAKKAKAPSVPLNALYKDVLEGTITPAMMVDSFMEAADHLDRELAQAIDAMADALYPMHDIRSRLHEKGVVAKEVMQTGQSHKEVLQRARGAALIALNELGVQTGAKIEQVSSKARQGRRVLEVSTLKGDRKLRNILGIQSTDSARFSGPGEFDPDETAGWKLGKHNVLEGEAAERAKRAIRVAQRNQYRIIPEKLAALDIRDIVGQEFDTLYERVLDNPNDPAKFVLEAAQAKLDRLHAAVERHAQEFGPDAPIMFRWRADDKGRIYADGEFTPQSKQLKYLFSGNGTPLESMWEVDHTGSGWQIAAYAARDEVLAPTVNIHGGQMGQANPVKGDIYADTRDTITSVVNRDAAAGNKLAMIAKKGLVDNENFQGKKGRQNTKTPVIAINYGGGPGNFERGFTSSDGQGRSHDFTDALKEAAGGKLPPGFWGYINQMGYGAVEEMGPATARMKHWSTNLLRAAVGAANQVGAAEDLQWTVGSNGTYAKTRYLTEQDSFEVRDRREEAQIKQASRAKNRERPTMAVDVDGTARTIFSQIIQGFDAEVLHNALARFGAENPGVFVSPNHDSYTLEPRYAPAIAKHVREVMHETLGTDGALTQNLYQDVVDQIGMDRLMEYANEYNANLPKGGKPIDTDMLKPFDGFGSYNPDEILTAIPMWAEGPGIDGAAPPDAPIVAKGIDDHPAQDFGETTGVRLDTSLPKMAQLAQDGQWASGRDFKVVMQEMALASQEGEVDLTQDTPEAAERLIDFLVEDTLAAAVNNMNAVGWYGRKVTAAKKELAKIYPELLTDPEAEFKFIWALAVTSNGIKVNQNFEMAAEAYEHMRDNGVFPTNIGTGKAAASINAGLKRYTTLVDMMGGWEAARDFMVERRPVREIKKIWGKPIGKEGAAVMLPGAVILGPKIGGGFFSNLYGNFDELTMDRWFTRTVGRWRGKLIDYRPDMEAKKQGEMRDALKSMTTSQLRALRNHFPGYAGPIRKTMTADQINNFAVEVTAQSQDAAWRTAFNNAGFEQVRLVGNSLSGYLDGQIEDPGGPNNRKFIRDIFTRGLEKIRQHPNMGDMSMSDLQAMLWYPEKLLYDTAKKKPGEEATAYADEEAPDYENAAKRLVRIKLGSSGPDGSGGGGGRPAQSGPDGARPADDTGGAIPRAEGVALGRETYPGSWLNEAGVPAIGLQEASRLVNEASRISGVPVTSMQEANGGWADPAQPGGVATEPSTVIELGTDNLADVKKFASILGHMAGQHSVMVAETGVETPNASLIEVRGSGDLTEVFRRANNLDPDAFGGFSQTEDGIQMLVFGDYNQGLMDSLLNELGDLDVQIEVDRADGSFIGADTDETSEGGQGYAASLGNVGVGQAEAEALLGDARRAAEAVFAPAVAAGVYIPNLQAEGTREYAPEPRRYNEANFPTTASGLGEGQTAPLAPDVNFNRDLRGADPILDEIAQGTNRLSPSAKKDLAVRVVNALSAGNIDNMDLYRLGMTPEGLIRMQTLAATGDQTYGGANGEGSGVRNSPVPSLEGTGPEGSALLDSMPIAQGVTTYTRGPRAIFSPTVDEGGLLRGLTASFRASDHPSRTLAKLRHNEAPFNGSRYEALLGKTRTPRENLTAQLNYATDLANYLDEVADRLPAGRFEDLRNHLDRMANIQLYIADERANRQDTSVQIRIPRAMGVVAPEGMTLGLPKTSDTFNELLDIAKHPYASSQTFLQKLEDNVFNRMAPIRRLEEAVHGELGIGAESAFKAAETAVNDSGRNESLMFYGAAKLGDHGEFTVDGDTVGLRPIFDIVVDGQKGEQAGQTMADWMGWMAARRIQGLQAKDPSLKFPMKDLQAALAKEQPQFAEAALQWQRHNNANIKFLVDTGRITPEQADAMKEDEFYVPFYRADSKADGTPPDLVLPDTYGAGRKGRGQGNNLLARNPNIKKLVGGDRLEIDNIMNNMVRNSQAMVAAGMRNKAANQIFELMGEAGLVTKTKARKKGKSGNFVDVAKPSEHAVKLWINGKPKWAIPQPGAEPYLIAMAGLQPIQLRGVLALMANIGSIFRQGITLSPAFMIRNLIRGMVANGLLTTGANLHWHNNTMTGMRDAYQNGAATRAFKAMSGMGDFRFGGKDVGFGQDDILIEYGVAPKTWGYRLRKAIDKAEHVGTATELADRVAAMNTMIARGMRPDEAAYQARAVMDYARHGGWPAMRAYLPMVPFLNARLQGLSRLTEGAVGKQGVMGRKQAAMQLALNGALLSIISAAIWGLNSRDEETEERYKAEPLHRRLNYHIVYAGDKAIYIPKAFELGHVFSSIPEVMLDATFRDMGDEATPAMKQIFASTIGMNLIPAGALPIVEGQANYSFFRQGPIESRREQSMTPRDRVTGAGALARFIGQQLKLSDVSIPGFEMVFGADQGKISPVYIQHYLEGYFGAYFHTLSGATDMATAELGFGSAPVGGAWGDVPVGSRLMERVTGSMFRNVDQQTTKYMEEFYRNRDWITQIYRSAKDAAANGDVEYARRLLEKSPGTQAAYKLVNKASSQLGDINAGIRAIRADTKMTPAQKRAKIEPLIRARNEYVKQVALMVKKIEEQQGSTFRSGT